MKLINYLQETKAELRHVNWPTYRQTMVFTILVVVLSLLIALFLGFFDFTLSQLLDIFILN